jgi:hypothetical protein
MVTATGAHPAAPKKKAEPKGRRFAITPGPGEAPVLELADVLAEAVRGYYDVSGAPQNVRDFVQAWKLAERQILVNHERNGGFV